MCRRSRERISESRRYARWGRRSCKQLSDTVTERKNLLPNSDLRAERDCTPAYAHAESYGQSLYNLVNDSQGPLLQRIQFCAAAVILKLTLCTLCRRLFLHNGSLIINNVLAEDAGIYKCVGYTNSGPVQTFAVQLILACKLITYDTVYDNLLI